MAHVHGAAAKGAAEASKHAAEAAHHSAHAAHSAMEHSAHLAHAAHHSAHAANAAAGHLVAKAAPSAVSFHNVAKGAVATGAVATAGHSLFGRILRHPLVLFGLGVAVGYAVHKYRQELIESADRIAETSKEVVLQQRENLEDLVAEGHDAGNSPS